MKAGLGLLGLALMGGLISVNLRAETPVSQETRPVLSPILSFAVVPQQSASKLAKRWLPLLKVISAHSGIELRFVTAPDIPSFERRVWQGEYDIAYMNPYHFTVFQQQPGYRAVARVRDKRIRGILVVRNDSPLTELGQLAGQQLAFPAPAAFAASVLPRSNLRKRGIEFDAKYVSSHDSVYRAVAKGLFPAGGGIVRTLKNLDPAIRAELRVLWTTPGYTPHAFAAHPRVSAAHVKALIEAMVTLNQSAAGREALAGLSMAGLAAANDSDWDDVRALNIQLLDSLLESGSIENGSIERGPH